MEKTIPWPCVSWLMHTRCAVIRRRMRCHTTEGFSIARTPCHMGSIGKRKQNASNASARACVVTCFMSRVPRSDCRMRSFEQTQWLWLRKSTTQATNSSCAPGRPNFNFLLLPDQKTHGNGEIVKRNFNLKTLADERSFMPRNLLKVCGEHVVFSFCQFAENILFRLYFVLICVC